MQLRWTCEMGDGPRPVSLPHVWHGQAPVTWEGPALYRTTLTPEASAPWMIFEGASCRALVKVNGGLQLVHQGIWDAFALDLRPWVGREVEVEVEAVKNGGRSMPVKEVASGFLPYVYHTFGGLWRPVRMASEPDVDQEPCQPWVTVEGRTIFVKGEPFFCRGLLTWGWNPRTGGGLFSDEEEEEMISTALRHGFNVLKFCLWVPSHRLLRRMEEEGLLAWMELPIWMPSPDHWEDIRRECIQIVRQHRGHPNILAWTLGCELGEGIDPEWRKSLVEEVQKLTGHPLIKDNSGGAEMYGGHPEEFGTFEDFHPYSEPQFFPLVLDSLAPGPRQGGPILLGETNDYDVFRPLHQWVEDPPYWASSDPALNDQGVRWQYDIPGILEACRATELGGWLASRSEALERSSKSQSQWMRLKAMDAMRLTPGLSGWVLTGERHTPISSAGVTDDEGRDVLPPESTKRWTSDSRLMLLPRRSPPWVRGGNRPGWESPWVRWAGPSLFQWVHHSVKEEGETRAWAAEKVKEEVVDLSPGCHRIAANLLGAEGEELIHVVEPLGPQDSWLVLGSADEIGLKSDPEAPCWIGFDQSAPGRGVLLADRIGTLPGPWFREGCWSWEDSAWEREGWVDQWELMLQVAGDKLLDPSWLDQVWPGWRPLLVRLDTRTFQRRPAAVLTPRGVVVTTMRPHGGLGIQPTGVRNSPAGASLLRLFRRLLAAEGEAGI